MVEDAPAGILAAHAGGKTLGPDASGEWRCDVVQDGTVLQSVKFKVE